MLTEKLLHFIWRFRLFNFENLTTMDGEMITILHPGTLNLNAGPDFLEAKIRIGKTLWAGHIELHLLSSDWNKHHHEQDPRYERLILHVVYTFDGDFKTRNSTIIPVVELNHRIALSLITQYQRLSEGVQNFPCSTFIPQIDSIHIRNQMDRMMAERLELQVSQVQVVYDTCHQDFDELCYRRIARSFGIHINQDAFEELSIVLPYSILRKYRAQFFQMESLLFGTAGMLQEYFDEDFSVRLQAEFSFLQKKHLIASLPTERWKFLRLRPSNFPTIRIAQFASLIQKHENLSSLILQPESLKEFERVLQVESSPFWDTHYTLKECSAEKKKTTGRTFIHGLMINAVIPLLFFYSRYFDKPIYKARALHLLQQLPFEKNSVTHEFHVVGFPGLHAQDSQSLIQLKKHYCDEKKCLECAIGFQVMKGSTEQ